MFPSVTAKGMREIDRLMVEEMGIGLHQMMEHAGRNLTEVARTLERAQAGVSVGPEDPAAFLTALRGLLAQPAAMQAMGRSGRAFVESWVSPAAVAARYEELFGDLSMARSQR